MSFLDRIFNEPKPRGIGPTLAAYMSPEFASLLDSSAQHLAAVTQLHEANWRFGKHKTWNFSQSEGLLRFSYADGTVAECSAQAIGSYSQNDGTWSWAWDNPSINASLKRDAELMRHYGQEHKFVPLTIPEWQATLDDSWAMTAASVLVCNAAGAYCGQMGPLSMFFAFTYPSFRQP